MASHFKQKQKLIKYNNERKNCSRIQHTYHVGDDVLMINPDSQKIETPYLGPYKVTAIHDNGTLTIKKEHVYETMNIHTIKTVLHVNVLRRPDHPTCRTWRQMQHAAGFVPYIFYGYRNGNGTCMQMMQNTEMGLMRKGHKSRIKIIVRRTDAY